LHSYNGLGGKKEKNIQVHRILAAQKEVANSIEDRRYGIYFDADLIKFGVAGEVPGRLKSEAVMLKVSNAINKLDNVLQEIRPNCAKQEAPSLEKSVSCDAGVATAKTDSDKEEEDEVIFFRPTVIEKHSESTTSNSLQNTTASARIHNMISPAAPQESGQKVSSLPLFELSLQISGYSMYWLQEPPFFGGIFNSP